MNLVSFLDDTHLFNCLIDLHKTYVSCKNNMTLSKFYKNKIDPIKLQFDMTFNNLNLEEYINLEVTRQNDKTISNAIGHFHQELLGGISGLESLGVGGGCDIRSLDNTIFAEIKNKHNTMNSSSQESTYQKLIKFADEYPNATCYLVEIIATQSQDIQWQGTFNGTYYSHPKVRRISADRFYALVTGKQNAFYELCSAIPKATQILLSNIAQQNNDVLNQNAVLSSLIQRSNNNNVDILTQIMKDNFTNYYGF
ncbi:type-2 restriction enzyme Sau96I [Gottschalkia acidurici 9a]|uniref:Type-2 restriction enzyme Sau96I n=1 Tax=Gottschalkia acidurici (strain ATCC 7906 / DSM 604 / BCRC 14475 / CIP 104303 / KCTC 5404 / NCIMB 10678 / 9a) TaxID=1128398 RepID=K0AXG2_GOTA9|nr:Eco47II family restriction endonuclease [Gottschalkia acidurici]AFS77874.1 type-2 restriction enzyme Sau96I [Gottschalkia acidurici 9a]